jgi:hypothetical protein
MRKVQAARQQQERSRMDFLYEDGFSVVRVGTDRTGNIGHIALYRPDKSNAFNSAMWVEFPKVSSTSSSSKPSTCFKCMSLLGQ